eukprot:CAMPEP_0113945960 /NCGR_PEP_ID=MMETSP1339-20121228/53329_1 /TAXON_ID=94617 /ORGANISM="Fibrocapsa japonica" /LENGTH=235 /DNA_ID=CAMNT_0000951823 /DNA_START=104 /DNA_END=811 /DNA_ORIENTATION=- /assembly_acc=CAM_ASM_000762
MAAKTNSSLLLLSSLALVLPTVVWHSHHHETMGEAMDELSGELTISRLAAVMLLFIYTQLLFFQLKTHRSLFEDDDDNDEEPMSFWFALGGLAFVTVLVTFFSDYLVSSIDGFTEEAGLSKTFVGIILLPIVGNVVEHIAAVTVAMKDKMELAMGIAVGSGAQVSIFVIPATVIIAWAMDKPMSLSFTTFEISTYAMAIIIVAHCVSSGSSNWLYGSMLITTYVLVAIAFWFEKV